MKGVPALVAVDVLVVLNNEYEKTHEVPKQKIFMNHNFLLKMLDRHWHTILLNTRTMRMIGVILDKYQYIRTQVSNVVGNHSDLGSMIVEYIRPWYHLVADATIYECGSYKIFACDHRTIC